MSNKYLDLDEKPMDVIKWLEGSIMLLLPGCTDLETQEALSDLHTDLHAYLVKNDPVILFDDLETNNNFEKL